MEKIHQWPAVVAATITTGIVYTACAVLFVFFPTRALSFFKSWFHGIDLAKITSDVAITFPSFFIGLLEVIIMTAVLTLIFVWTYNSCVNHCEIRGWLKKE